MTKIGDSEERTEVAIIGAGISGLLAAKGLKKEGIQSVVFEKSRGYGGRMATRRSDHAKFDHGAQYFTARDPGFKRLVEGWLQEGLVRPWSTGFVSSHGKIREDGETRWVGCLGMNTVPKALAADLDVRTSTKINSIRWNKGSWHLDSDGGAFKAHSLIMTSPVPQTLALLDAGGVHIDPAIRTELEAVVYAPCIALMVELSEGATIPEPGGIWDSGEPVSWVADNVRKGISPSGRGAITIHAGPEFSRKHWDIDGEWVKQQLLDASKKWLGDSVSSVQLHRWRFSIPQQVHPERFVLLDQPGPILFAGDAFGGPRIEGAACSGMAAANALRNNYM